MRFLFCLSFPVISLFPVFITVKTIILYVFFAICTNVKKAKTRAERSFSEGSESAINLRHPATRSFATEDETTESEDKRKQNILRKSNQLLYKADMMS